MSGTVAFPELFASPSFLGEPAIVVAVSGGSDSVALLLLAHDALETASSKAKLLAVTVDHGLRDESAAEAQAVAELCRGYGIAHCTAVWAGERPTTGLPAAARLARHRLLAETASEASARIVLTGHTLNDQAETVIMRRQRGEGLGLAGIAPATLYDGGIWFMRPLLGQRREALRDYLAHKGVGWIDDPTNANMDFERARVRARLSGITDGAEEIDAAIAVADEAKNRRMRLAGEAAQLIRAFAEQLAPGKMRLGVDLLQQTNRDAALHALRILLASVGQAEHLPDLPRASALFEKLAHGGRGRFSLVRVVVQAKADAIFLTRETRRVGQGAGTEINAPIGAPDTGPQVLYPWPLFIPSFELEPARALAELVGAVVPPTLPQ